MIRPSHITVLAFLLLTLSGISEAHAQIDAMPEAIPAATTQTSSDPIAEPAKTSSSAVAVVYHRIDEDAFGEGNLPSEQFLSHIEEIAAGGYTVMPLPAIMDALKNGTGLPENTIAITFDGGYKSAYTHAIPELVKRKIPFTVFFASDKADAGSGQYINWQDIEALKKTGLATFGLMPASLARLAFSEPETIAAEINKARVRFREKLDAEPAFFSYPYGEYSLAYKDIIAKQGFTAAFGLHSGALYASADMLALPRFSLTESYGSLERFKLVARALPLEAENITPADPNIVQNPPAIGFSVPDTIAGELKNLSCFVSGAGKINTDIVGETRVELRLSAPLEQERTRVNCTIPVKSGDDTNWRWFGMMLFAQPHDETEAEAEAEAEQTEMESGSEKTEEKFGPFLPVAPQE